MLQRITIFVDILRTSSFQEFTYEFGKAVFIRRVHYSRPIDVSLAYKAII